MTTTNRNNMGNKNDMAACGSAATYGDRDNTNDKSNKKRNSCLRQRGHLRWPRKKKEHGQQK